MVKKVLIIGYSQTGQLHKVLKAIKLPLTHQNNIEVTFKALEPIKAYDFPWSFFNFFDTFPECIYLDAPKNKALNLESNYDLVILGYQPWFLAPSLPTTAFLKSKQAQVVLKNTPVITVIACRNMWVQAQQKILQMLNDLDANLIGNAVLTDQGSSLVSFITTPRWLLTGKKNGFWRFPKAGISEKEIEASARFGKAISYALNTHQLNSNILKGLSAVKVHAGLLQSEKIGSRSFHIWGKLLRSLGARGSWIRKPILLLYLLFLILMIISVVPISLLLRAILKPFFRKKIKALEAKFELPSGADDSRISEFLC
ncbi:hypothetical protein [Bathymodiolus septemdierum thioautotrophic gill symbiont]|uniref:Dialkylrecorsinol condensing enzyme n=1 Tax=endosymbiont of Bathymodiolus septemdierum str. Myojin knoll TaxID=1303921 RepID=A0A0P0USR7_9GAMM|nr:hypothetical protein [Bathymodiolus septemdierum thioautotrophic gill symbiont]BAS68339.1 conserved hypothetical protein [endosymbiont of Bathymodiolus septemdierum str. Myojin knoll]